MRILNYNKDEYEKLIDESNLFSIDKEKQRSLYKREALKMVEYLYCYLLAIKQQQYEPYGMEIVATAKRCIENYKSESGRFLNYFNSAWKKEYGHIVGKEIIRESFSGIHFTDEDERNFRKYMKLAQSLGIDTSTSEFNEKILEAMGVSLKEVNMLRDMVNCKISAGTQSNEEGEEYSIIDQIDSGNYVETGFLQAEEAINLLDLFDDVFQRLQDRQKPMLAKILTSKLTLIVIDDDKIVNSFKTQSYFDNDIYEECIRRNDMIQTKEIAMYFGKTEASVSRTWKDFKEKIIEERNKRS